MMSKKPSIFVAHSSVDIEDVRIVRNLLEKRGHNVLLLHLEQSMTHDYLEQLIREEIKARDWLVVLASENARRSRWVPFEEAYARLHEKPTFHVRHEECAKLQDQLREDCFDHQVAEISRDVRIFVSHSWHDEEMALRLSRDLETEGYEVWNEVEQLHAGTNWAEQIKIAVEATLQRGFLIILVSAHSSTNPYVISDLQLAFAEPERIIPCLIEPSPRFLPPFLLADPQYVDFRSDYNQGLRKLIRMLQHK